MTERSRIVPLLAFVPWFTFWNNGTANIPDNGKIRVALASSSSDCKQVLKSFNATIARSDASRAKGLSHRSSKLAADEAMLFAFEQPMKVSFWMKDTLIPLQIGYFDAHGRLAESLDMPVEKNPADPVGRYDSSVAVSAALEVAPGALDGIALKKTLLCVEN